MLKINTRVNSVLARFRNKLLTFVEGMQQSEWWQMTKGAQSQAMLQEGGVPP